MDREKLIAKAFEVREKSYSPYSNFKVGAALLTKEGQIFTGTNVESAAFSPTICAERAALASAVSEGYTEFEAIAIAGSSEDFTFPCGVCRQTIREFGRDILIIVAKNETEYEEYTLDELLPHSFGPEDLKNE